MVVDLERWLYDHLIEQGIRKTGRDYSAYYTCAGSRPGLVLDLSWLLFEPLDREAQEILDDSACLDILAAINDETEFPFCMEDF